MEVTGRHARSLLQVDPRDLARRHLLCFVGVVGVSLLVRYPRMSVLILVKWSPSSTPAIEHNEHMLAPAPELITIMTQSGHLRPIIIDSNQEFLL